MSAFFAKWLVQVLISQNIRFIPKRYRCKQLYRNENTYRKFCCEITKGAWKFRNSIQPNGSETFRKFFHLLGWNGKSEVSVQVPFKFLKLFSCVQSSLRTTARRGLCWQRTSGNRYLQNSFRNESQKTPTFLQNKIKKLICVILLMVMVTCGKSLIPSLCANIALVSRLVICSARAARYLSLLDTR